MLIIIVTIILLFGFQFLIIYLMLLFLKRRTLFLCILNEFKNMQKENFNLNLI